MFSVWLISMVSMGKASGVLAEQHPMNGPLTLSDEENRSFDSLDG